MGVDIGDVARFDPRVDYGLRPGRRDLQAVGLDGDGVEGVVGEAAPQHMGVPLDVTPAGHNERSRRLPSQETLTALLEGSARVLRWTVGSQHAERTHPPGVLGRDRQIGTTHHHVGGEPTDQPLSGQQNTERSRRARRAHIHRRTMEPVLGHEHRRRRRRQQLQIVASPHVPTVLVVQVAPALYLPEGRAQDQPHPSPGAPAASRGVGQRLTTRPVQGPTEKGDRVLLASAVRHRRSETGELPEHRRARRGLAREQPVPQALRAPPVPGHRSHPDDPNGLRLVHGHTLLSRAPRLSLRRKRSAAWRSGRLQPKRHHDAPSLRPPAARAQESNVPRSPLIAVRTCPDAPDRTSSVHAQITCLRGS